MTFDQLKEKFGTGLNPAEWAQHPNGGGWVQSTARVETTAWVGPDARSGNARVYGGRWKVSPLYIQGSCYSLTHAKPGHIAIGCEIRTVDFWCGEEAAELARTQGFSDAQIAEYRAYIELFKGVS